MNSIEYNFLNEFKNQLKYKLDPFQIRACQFLEDNKSVLVASPTGSGKTTVAEFSIWLAQSNQKKVIYTSPIKALSNQKFHELLDVYGEERVGLLTGDINIRAEASILVMTTEVLRNMIYEDSATLTDLSHVVLDEVHYLADKSRGAVWEEIILHLPKHIKLVCLSATVSNAEEFGEWLHTVRGDTEVIVSEKRPVPLYQHVFTKGQLMPLFVDHEGELVEKGKLNRDLLRLEKSTPTLKGSSRPNRRFRTDFRALVTQLEVDRLLPAIVFIFSRNGCDMAVRNCVYNGVRLTNRDERLEIRRVAKEHIRHISKEDLYSLGYNHWLQALEHGIAAHHAGLIPPFKTIIEKLFQRKLVKLVFATETLALGINMPAKSVVIDQLVKFDGVSQVPLLPGEFTQLTGRAGRRGIDTEGHAIIVWEHRTDLDHIATLASKRVYPLRSSFRPTYNMAVNLLERLDLDLARNILERSFAQFQADHEMVNVAEEIRAAQSSLAGYQRAVERSQGAERKKWQDRARKLNQNIKRKVKRLERRTGTISRVFDRLVEVLQSLEYLKLVDGTPKPTAHGNLLRSIYGERDLLVAECIRSGVWDSLNPVELTAMCSALVYEPRRDDEYSNPRIPGGAFRDAFDETMNIWSTIDAIEEVSRLSRSEPPHAGMCQAMIKWARGASLEDVLGIVNFGPGDFIRITKQTIDLLDQLHRLRDIGFNELSQKAAESRRLIARGIVEVSSRA